MLLAAVVGEAMLSSLLLIAKLPLVLVPLVPPLLLVLAVVAGEATEAASKSISLNIRFSYTNLPAAIHSAA
jgi:hypothetical protein